MNNNMKKYIKSSEDIFSHAMGRSQFVAELEDTVRPTVKHLIKLACWPNAQEVDHWRDEVYSFLHNVPLLKSSKRLPTANLIYQNTYKIDEPYMQTWYKNTVLDYSDEYGYPEKSFYEIMPIVESYYRWLSLKLSTTGDVSKKEITAKLKELSF